MDETANARPDRERDAIAAAALLAARADGSTGDEERARLREVFDAVGGVDSALLSRRVLIDGVGLDAVAAELTTPGARAFAFEMAVGVCDADGRTTPAERAFLDDLAARLGIPAGPAGRVLERAEELAELPAEGGAAAWTTAGTATGAGADPGAGNASGGDAAADAARPSGAADRAALERRIRDRAILAGALELLPQSLATMAIVPLQVKLVHEIAGAHGVRVGADNAREFLGVIGVGLTSQVLEGYARKLFGSVLKKRAGRGAARLGRTAAGAATTFATTYAIGTVADDYYARGRALDPAALRARFQESLGKGRELFATVEDQVRGRASRTGPADLARLLRG